MSDGLSYGEFELLNFWIALERAKPSFYKYAECKGEDLNTFFPGQGQSFKQRIAIEVCFTCPVQRDCHDYSIKNQIEYGVWGGSGADLRRKWIQDGVSVDAAWEELLQLRNQTL